MVWGIYFFGGGCGGNLKQIPGGNDRKRGKGSGQYRDPSLRSRMTTKSEGGLGGEGVAG